MSWPRPERALHAEELRSSREVLSRIGRLETLQKVDLETSIRLAASQRNTEYMVDQVQDGMDALALQCSSSNRPNNTEFIDYLATMNGKIDSLVSNLKRLERTAELKPSCIRSNGEKTATSPGVALKQPKSTQMATRTTGADPIYPYSGFPALNGRVRNTRQSGRIA